MKTCCRVCFILILPCPCRLEWLDTPGWLCSSKPRKLPWWQQWVDHGACETNRSRLLLELHLEWHKKEVREFHQGVAQKLSPKAESKRSVDSTWPLKASWYLCFLSPLKAAVPIANKGFVKPPLADMAKQPISLLFLQCLSSAGTWKCKVMQAPIILNCHG